MAIRKLVEVTLKALDLTGPGSKAAVDNLAKVEKQAKETDKAGKDTSESFARGAAKMAAGMISAELAMKAVRIASGFLKAAIGEAFKSQDVDKFKASLTDVGDAWRELLSRVGAIITQSPAVQAAMAGIADILRAVTGALQDSSAGADSFIKGSLTGLLRGFEVLVVVGEAVAKVFIGFKAAFLGAVLAFQQIGSGFLQSMALIADGWTKLTNLFLPERMEFDNAFADLANAAKAMAQDTADAIQTQIDAYDEAGNASGRMLDAIEAVRRGVDGAAAADINWREASKGSTAAVKEGTAAIEEQIPLLDQLLETKRMQVDAERIVAAEQAATAAATQAQMTLIGSLIDDANRKRAEEKASIEASKQEWRDWAAGLVDVGSIVSGVFSALENAIGEAVAFSREAMGEFVQDNEWAAESARLAHERALMSRREAQEAYREAQERGDARALKAAKLALDEATLAEQKSSRDRKKANDQLNDAKIKAEKSTGKIIAESLGKALLEMLRQILATAATQMIVAGIVASAKAIEAHAGIPYVGLIIGGAAAAAVAAIIGGLASQLPKAATGGWVTGGVEGQDSVPILAMPGELVLPTSVARGLLAAARNTVGGPRSLPPVGISSLLPRAAQGGMVSSTFNAGANVVLNLSMSFANAPANPREFARQLAPALREELARGGF